MKKLIVTSVVALFFCFTSFGQSGKCQPKCGGGDPQTASIYNLTNFNKPAESRSRGGAESQKNAESRSCGVAESQKVAKASTVSFGLTPSCSPTPSCSVAQSQGCKPAVSQKCGSVKPKSRSIAKL